MNFGSTERISSGRSELNQLQCCEAQESPLKAFSIWRAKLKAEPQPPARVDRSGFTVIRRAYIKRQQ